MAKTPFVQTLTETLQAFAAANLEDLGYYTVTEGDVRQALSRALSPAVVDEASRKLMEVFRRDFPTLSQERWPVDPGAWNYVVRSVAEALVGNLE